MRWRLDVLRLAVAVSVMVLFGALAAVAAGTFSDDDGNIHEKAIEAIADEGITKGCNPPTNDVYCPGDPVTRGQMAAFLVRAMGYTDSDGDLFDDDNGSTFEADINKLATAGVTKGCNPPANDQFCPDDLVTRGQMAAFLVRAMGYFDGGAENLFGDDDGSTFEQDIQKLATAGVTKGCNPPANSQFCPDDPVLRDQMASFLARALINISFSSLEWGIEFDFFNPGIHRVSMVVEVRPVTGQQIEDLAGTLVWDETVVDLCGIAVRNPGGYPAVVGDKFGTHEGCGVDPNAMQDAFDAFGLPNEGCLTGRFGLTQAEYCEPLP